MSDTMSDASKGPVLALREAMLAHLVTDAALVALLAGPRVYDEPPRGITGVYASFSETRVRDWSTGSDCGCEQECAITVWSQEGGARAGLATADRISQLLHEATLTLDGHRLVNLRVVGSDTRRDARANRSRTILRLRAVTETIVS